MLNKTVSVLFLAANRLADASNAPITFPVKFAVVCSGIVPVCMSS